MRPADRVEHNRLNGISAENRVASNYQRCGFELIAKRYRTGFGEIDLIFKHDDRYYFTEVKRAKDHDTALSYLKPAQIGRMQKTVMAFLADKNLPLETDMRFDAALVNRVGRVKVIPNILH